MSRLELIINGKTCVLTSESKVSIEETSPLFNDEGSFSYPFQIDLRDNKKIFGAVDVPESDDSLSERMPFVLKYDGIQILTGDSDVSTSGNNSSIDINLNDTYRAFMERIDDLKCREVKQIRKVLIGTYKQLCYDWRTYYNDDITNYPKGLSSILPYDMDQIINVEDEYGKMDFCNTNVICYFRNTLKAKSNTFVENPDAETKSYLALADRPGSGICFYLLYLLDCIISHSGFTIRSNRMMDIEDFKRLAFFSTSFKFEEESIGETAGYGNLYNLYATSDNFPDISASDFINSMQNAFGMRMIVDKTNDSVDIVLMKDVLTSNDVIDLNLEVISASKEFLHKNGLTIKYDPQDGLDRFFKYDFSGDIEFVDNYSQASGRSGQYTSNTKIDKVTGNAYRYWTEDTLEEGTENVDNETPSSARKSTVRRKQSLVFTEVGQFNPIQLYKERSDQEEISIGFNPVVINIFSSSTNSSGSQRPEYKTQTGVFVDMELENIILEYTYNANAKSPDRRSPKYETIQKVNISTPDLSEYDAGFAVCLMRGPGTDDDYVILPEYLPEDYGAQVYEDSNKSGGFSSDSVDVNGALYDYLGSGIPEDIPESERFSLKLSAIKDAKNSAYPNGIIPSKYPYRGIYHKLLSEYAYFLCNRRTIILPVWMSIAQIKNIQWSKKYKINNYVGFINRISYTLTPDSISQVEVEMYII